MAGNRKPKEKKEKIEERSYIEEAVAQSIELRSKHTEFYGLQRELRYIRAEMLAEYEKSKDIKHPRDVGRAREIILENFLIETGLFPNKYGISAVSARVVAPTGHYSRELDIVIYNRAENVQLMRRNKALEYYPRECSYGSIQVKSRLGKKEITEAFANIASYKKLYEGAPPFVGMFLGTSLPTTKGFGIVFAYETDLEWVQIIKEIETQCGLYEKQRWPNAIFVLKKGVCLFGDEKRVCITNEEIDSIVALQIHARPDQGGSTLFNLYSLLMQLLANTNSSPLNINAYYNLPHTIGELSYEFALGAFMEVGACPQHGRFLRKIPEEKLVQVVAYCRTQTPRNWISITREIYDQPEDKAAEARQPFDVYIYNPENLPLKEILRSDLQLGITYDIINTAGLQVWVPWYYSAKYGIIEGCLTCQKAIAKKERSAASQEGDDTEQ